MRPCLFPSTIWLLSCATAAAAPPIGPESAHTPRPAGQSSGGVLWEIIFEDGTTTEEYTRQVDQFKIEIGAVSKSGKVEYISKVSGKKPEKRVSRKEGEYRFATEWKKGNLHATDRKLLAKAGITSEGKQLLHYFPADVQSQLSALERAYAGREPSEIRRTRFLVRPKAKGDDYEFVVIEQDPPKPSEPPAVVTSADKSGRP